MNWNVIFDIGALLIGIIPVVKLWKYGSKWWAFYIAIQILDLFATKMAHL